jgi:hypothetical protein
MIVTSLVEFDRMEVESTTRHKGGDREPVQLPRDSRFFLLGTFPSIVVNKFRANIPVCISKTGSSSYRVLLV